MGPADLERILVKLPRYTSPDLLVGISTGDDAAVFRIGAELALVQTLDFFLPVVDDPRDYGRIAAANSISDVYAMGGRPILALSIVGLPLKKIGPEVMAEVLAGGAEVCAEAGIGIVGGHSIDDEEMKFGLSVSGLVHPDRLLRNDRGQIGDLLVLTKPIGSGTIAHRIKKSIIRAEEYADLIRVTTHLNRVPSEVAVEHGLRCATDITGFGLLGHALGIARGSNTTLELWIDAIPLLTGALSSLAEGAVPGATGRNLAYYGPDTRFDVDELAQRLVADPQTSGGLLLAVPPQKVDAVCTALLDRGAICAAVVGRLGAPEAGPTARVLATRRPG